MTQPNSPPPSLDGEQTISRGCLGVVMRRFRNWSLGMICAAGFLGGCSTIFAGGVPPRGALPPAKLVVVDCLESNAVFIAELVVVNGLGYSLFGSASRQDSDFYGVLAGALTLATTIDAVVGAHRTSKCRRYNDSINALMARAEKDSRPEEFWALPLPSMPIKSEPTQRKHEPRKLPIRETYDDYDY